jgi:hypothetical protein
MYIAQNLTFHQSKKSNPQENTHNQKQIIKKKQIAIKNKLLKLIPNGQSNLQILGPKKNLEVKSIAKAIEDKPPHGEG